MIKNKNNTLNKIFKYKIIVFIAAILSLVAVTAAPVQAAPAGCYVSANGFIAEYTCPTRDFNTGVNSGLCYVFAGGSSGVSDSGVETDCNAITVGNNNSGTGSGTGGPRTENSGVDVEPARFDNDAQGCNEAELNTDNCRIIEYLVIGINVLSAIAGMAIIFSIMFAGFQYMTAQDNAGQIQQARTRIIWAISAMLIFIFMYALLNYLVPGGVF